MSDTKATDNNEPKHLTNEQVYELAGVFARLEHLKNTPADVQILQPNGDPGRTPDAQQLTRDAEIQVLAEHLMGTFLQHGAEFIGTWLAMRTEFAPLVRALAPLLKRCVAMPDPQAPLMPESMRPNADVKGGAQ